MLLYNGSTFYLSDNRSKVKLNKSNSLDESDASSRRLVYKDHPAERRAMWSPPDNQTYRGAEVGPNGVWRYYIDNLVIIDLNL